MPDHTPVEELEQKLRSNWEHLGAARQRAEATTAQLRNALHRFDSADSVIVVSGSLARQEFTMGSDIDWALRGGNIRLHGLQP